MLSYFQLLGQKGQTQPLGWTLPYAGGKIYNIFWVNFTQQLG